MTKDIEATITLTELPPDVLLAAATYVRTHPDAETLLAMLGLDEVAE